MAEITREVRTYKSASQLGAYLLVKEDLTTPDPDTVSLAGLGEGNLVMGVTEPPMVDETTLSPVRLFPANTIFKVTASAAVTKGALLYPAASGKVSSTVAGPPIARAVQTASGDGSVISARPLTPAELLAAAMASGSPGDLLVIPVDVADGATADVTVFSANCPFKFRVADFLFECNSTNGANANTMTLCAAAAGASPISDALALSGKVPGDQIRSVSCFPATNAIAKSGSLFIRRTKAGGTTGGRAYIIGYAST